jgi:hypothetical protein
LLTPFAPPPGLDSDDTTFSSEGRWVSGNNIRFVHGKPETIGNISQDLITGLGANAVTAMLAARRGTTNYVYIGSGAALNVSSAVSAAPTVATDITPAALGGVGSWSLSTFGSALLASPSGGKLYQYTGSGVATHVTQAPAQSTAMIVTQERQVLALGCNEEISTTFNGRCIRGSDLEDYTDWTTTSANNAFEHILDSDSDIVTGTLAGSYVVVWTTSAMFLGQFIGDPGQTYRFDKVADVGIVSHKGYAVDGDAVYFMAPDRSLYVWRAGGGPVPIPSPIARDFEANGPSTALNLAAVVLGRVSHFDEIWVLYPDSRSPAGAGVNTRYLAYSIRESTAAQRPVWFQGQMSRSAILDGGPLHLMYTNFASAPCLMADYDGVIYLHECVRTGGTAPVSYIQSADQYIDNSQRRMTIRGAIPDFEYQSGDVSLTLYMRDRPQSPTVTKGPYVLAATANKKDFRASGKIVAAKFSAESGSYFRLGKPLFDTVATGER